MTTNPKKDPLFSTPLVPADFEQYILPNTERMFYRSHNYQYLEQVYHSPDCVMAFLDFKVLRSCFTIPVADEPMITLLYMLMGGVRGELAGYGTAPLKQGHSYLLYLPAEMSHKAFMKKGHLRVMYCIIAKPYIDIMATENCGIANLLASFSSGSSQSIIEKPACISFNALYQMWQVKNCNNSLAHRQALLMSRGRDLVLDYVSEIQAPFKPVKKFVSDVLDRSDKIFEAKDVIDKSEKKLKIAAIAAMVGLTERQLEKGFKATFKKSIGKYQLELIIHRVCLLLITTNASVQEIAFEVGYSEVSNLSRIFRQVMGVTPTEYRENAVTPQELTT